MEQNENIAIRRAEEGDLERIWEIVQQAKRQLAGLGISQWQKGYPYKETFAEDIRLGQAYVAVDGETICGAFAMTDGVEPSYLDIDGKWLTGPDARYMTLHRGCVADGYKGRGIVGLFFDFVLASAAERGCGSLRIDTHAGNIPMQRALDRAGFQRCGNIWLVGGSESGDHRVAYELMA